MRTSHRRTLSIQETISILHEEEGLQQIEEGEVRRGSVVDIDSIVIKFVEPMNVQDMRQSSKYCAVHKDQFIPFVFWGFAVERIGDASYPKFFSSQHELFSFFRVNSFDTLCQQLAKEPSKYLISIWGRVQDTKNLQTLFFFQEKKNWVFGLTKTPIQFWSVLTT